MIIASYAGKVAAVHISRSCPATLAIKSAEQ